MRPAHRWAAVVLGTAVLVAVPAGLRAWPAQDRDVSAADLLSLVERGADHPYSGLVESQGTLQLPDADRFTDVGALFGEQHPDAGVVARRRRTGGSTSCSLAGETDLVHDERRHHALGLRARRRHAEPRPATSGCRARADLVPPELADRLLRGVGRRATSRRIPARRVAGVERPRAAARARPPTLVEHRPRRPLGRPGLRRTAAGRGVRRRRRTRRRSPASSGTSRRAAPAGATGHLRRRRPASTVELRRRPRHRRRRQPVRAGAPARHRGRAGQGAAVRPRGRRLRPRA